MTFSTLQSLQFKALEVRLQKASLTSSQVISLFVKLEFTISIIVDLDNIHNLGQGGDVITSPVGEEGFVSIDGKRTYLNLFGDGSVSLTSAAPVIKPSAPSNNQVTGTGYAVVDEKPKPNLGQVKPTQRRPVYGRPRPSQPPVRIDTCIVGDDSTCDGSQHEVCRTEAGVSACHCRPGHARRKHREPCRKIVSVLLSLRVDRLYERRIVWASELADKSSTSYQQLAYEAERAVGCDDCTLIVDTIFFFSWTRQCR